ncbi:MAG: hypothetical protein HEQ29_09225 [Dolichospermum sp. LBC05a]|nr:hypothetical protein [Dolichospermum sp. OL01]MCO5796947.1 hypothetical protein [Dolichospermum sp. OL03]MCS6280151.1 hypothetical protein [Dolichospermum sp.]QSV56953.1 MAG: hypothetical protein HEQ29_09225 [Dolichospermum sp. LBC05a]
MSVGAKHLEDKLSVIAKNSSPNASPVQLLVVNYSFLNILNRFLGITALMLIELTD